MKIGTDRILVLIIIALSVPQAWPLGINKPFLRPQDHPHLQLQERGHGIQLRGADGRGSLCEKVSLPVQLKYPLCDEVGSVSR